MEGGAFFEAMYEQAARDPGSIPWASLAPNPLLERWLHGRDAEPGAAIVVGCGLGDDAEALAARDWDVTAFDISPTAIVWARDRFPATSVHYVVADLLELPPSWRHVFSLVVEALTIQSLAPRVRPRVVAAIADLVAPGGTLLVSATGHTGPRVEQGPPWPVLRDDLSGFADAGLSEVEFGARPSAWNGFDHFEVEYHRPRSP